MIKRALKRGMTPAQIQELTGFSPHTISRVNTSKNYKEFCEKRVKRTSVANAQKKTAEEVPEENEEQTSERAAGIDQS